MFYESFICLFIDTKMQMQKFIFKRHLSCIVFELPIFIYLLHLKRVHNNIYILMVKLIAEGVTLEAPQEF